MHDLGILRPEFENNIVIFEISTPKFCEETTMPKFEKDNIF